MEIIIICIVIFLVIIGLLIKNNGHKGSFFEEETLSDIDRVIKIQNFNLEELSKAIKDFKAINVSGNGNYDYLSMEHVKQASAGMVLTLPDSVGFLDFALIVNYMVYSDKNKRHNNDIVGYYTFGKVVMDKQKFVLSGKKVQVFIPAEDEEYDNVYFKTEEGKRYKMAFTDWSIIEI